MEIDPATLQEVLESACRFVRVSVRQPNDAVIRQSRQRLSTNEFDVLSRNVIAASSLVRKQPGRTLELLQRYPDSLATDGFGNRLAGYAWLEKQDITRARQSFDAAVRLDPHQPDCWHLLGQIAESDDQYEQAVEYYQRGVLFDHGTHDSALALSRVHVRNRQLREAIHTLRISLIRDRRSAKLNLALARLLDRRAVLLGRQRRYFDQQRLRQESLECYRTVNASAPTCRTLVTQGRLEQQLFEYDRARESFQKAVRSDPNSAAALSHLAGSNIDFGEIDTALRQLEASLSMDPSRAETHFRYSRAKRFNSGATTKRYLATLNSELAQTDSKRGRQRQIYLRFALAKVYDDSGRFDEAWQHYDQANRLKAVHSRPRRQSKAAPPQSKAAPPAARSPMQTYTDLTIETFTPEFFQRMAGIGNPSRTPIFVVGMPRSGTTLTEQILSSHPEIGGAGELPSINLIRQEISRTQSQSANHLAMGCSPSADLLPIMDVADLRLHADQYLQQLRRHGGDKRRVTDKMPTNFIHLGLIAILFPGATVVHCRRDPMDVIVSAYCQNLNLPFCDLDQLIAYHRQYRRLMAHWERVLPLKIHSNQYESLVADPEPHARAMLQHCNMQWSDECLRFHKNHRAVHTPSKWQVRQPMYRSSVGKWRRFEKHLAPIAEKIAAEIAAENRQTLSDPG